jgi:hypothetical protein
MGPKFVFASFIFREKDGLGQGHLKKKKAGSTACNNNYMHIERWGSKTHSHHEGWMLGGWIGEKNSITNSTMLFLS